jgi:hypothetical protein
LGGLVLQVDGNDERKASWPWLQLNTAVPVLGVPRLPWLGIFLLFYPLFLAVNFVVRKVFLLDIRIPLHHSLKKFLTRDIDRNVFVVANAPFVKKAAIKESNLHLSDLKVLASSPNWVDTFDDESAGAVIALDQFDYRMDDPATNQQKLTLVERLLEKQRTLILFSSNESSHYRFQSNGNGHSNGDHDEDKWASVIIRNFSTEYAEDTDDGLSFKHDVEQKKMLVLELDLEEPPPEKIKMLFDTLSAECAPRQPLQDIGRKILEHKGFLDLSQQELLDRIINQARTYYQHIWALCSVGEKQTLGHLAQDQRLSYRDPDVASLLKRQLIIRHEGLHLFNESFRQFVLSEEQLMLVTIEDEVTRKVSLWQTFKMPILVALMAIAAFLFITQQELFDSSLAVVTGVTTIITAILKTLSMFQINPVDSASSKAG